jgi:hypothetical protein
MNRPKTYTVAAILQLLISLFAVVYAFPLLFQGAAAVDQVGDQPPYFVIVLAFCLGLLGIVSAYGVWRNQKWGVILTIALRAVDILLALPGVAGAPTLDLQIMATVGVAISVVIIVLLLWPTKSRLATPPSTEPS